VLLTFLGALATGVLGACVAFVIRRFTGASTRWMIPFAAGAGMLGFTIWTDYSWFDRQREGLPEDVVVVEAFEHSAALQPWTLIFPVVNRYSALDRAGAERHPARPELVRAPVFLAQRWQPSFVAPQVIDCAEGRRADAASVGGDGLPPEDAWFDLPARHPLLEAACAIPD